MIKKLLPLAFVLLLAACATAQPQTTCCPHCQECTCTHCEDGICKHDETCMCECHKDMHEKICMKHKT